MKTKRSISIWALLKARLITFFFAYISNVKCICIMQDNFGLGESSVMEVTMFYLRPFTIFVKIGHPNYSLSQVLHGHKRLQLHEISLHICTKDHIELCSSMLNICYNKNGRKIKICSHGTNAHFCIWVMDAIQRQKLCPSSNRRLFRKFEQNSFLSSLDEIS